MGSEKIHSEGFPTGRESPAALIMHYGGCWLIAAAAAAAAADLCQSSAAMRGTMRFLRGSSGNKVVIIEQLRDAPFEGRR